ncbi:MAG: DNA-directed RNA polymerase subunit beta' [Chloroflexi bacterium]|nr:DNA-directed RNA polymerase subunit beta' [Chloroflexota bacterium]
MLEVNDFNAVRISLASPAQIKSWSYGEVTKPETINYRTLKPEKDGLFCEKIFGPTKDFECYCGKYKRVRYKGVVCDKCGVEVARSRVRRERMGHINLAAPVTHIWFVKGTPSRFGLLLDLSPRSLERLIYFAQYIVTEVNDDERQRILRGLREGGYSNESVLAVDSEGGTVLAVEGEVDEGTDVISREEPLSESLSVPEVEQVAADRLSQSKGGHAEEASRTQEGLKKAYGLWEEVEERIAEVEDLRAGQLLTETRYQELTERYGVLFKAGMGAEALLDLVSQLDLDELCGRLRKEIISTSGQRRKKAIKRLRVAEAFRKSGNKPEWMVLTVLPVLPPDLRPMVQLDGGRFATSDLNDLYRRVINRNNRLKKLLELGAPEIIIRNEKRMLQEAVDSLIDNGRRGRAATGSTNHRLKSLSDMLKGKQGRFRQNLLGKRVDYSGRSVIIVGPELKLHQCGLPKRMALELFKPFVMRRLVESGFAHNIKSAKRVVERVKPEVWDIIEEVAQGRPVLLNRAPTLHRLGIQAFEPVLIDGSAIQVHPLVCGAFNADFDGDQMAVHVPLSNAAVDEARKTMLSIHNTLLPSSGEPTVAPTLDIVLGCFYMTIIRSGVKGENLAFSDFTEARLAYELEVIDLQAEIQVRNEKGDRLRTTVGRIIFNEIVPPELGFRNGIMDKKALRKVVSECHRLLGSEATALFVDDIKRIGFHYATKSGATIAIADIGIPPSKKELLREADNRIEEIEKQFRRGLITEEERYNSAIEIWTETTDRVADAVADSLDRFGSIYMMATSGAKGNISQIRQMAGMRGLMTDPSGRIIDLPIKSSFREGLSVLEYFISTHGARKGLADTALRTADSGYLTRRLVDVAQDVVVHEDDCGTTKGVWIFAAREREVLESFSERIIGRHAVSRIVHPTTGEIIVDRNEEITEDRASMVVGAGIDKVYVRSSLNCQSRRGVCSICYGRNLATGKLVTKGEAVGIIAAQSIGEPGTQLTMRTFHTGGTAGIDITSGLPRVEELFEARVPKGQAIISEIDGTVQIREEGDFNRVKVVSSDLYRDEYPIPSDYHVLVKEGDWVDEGAILALKNGARTEGEEEGKDILPFPPPLSLAARVSGRVGMEGGDLVISWEEREEREYVVPMSSSVIVKEGQQVKAGDKLTDGSVNPQDILRIMGKEAVQLYLVEEVQKVYRSQGVTINDKHIEIVVRQLLRKVKVDLPGDTGLLPDELVDRFAYEEINARVLAEGGEPATAQPVLLGVTKASLNTESFMAAASFQETTRVITEAAINGAVDRLVGLKENVIIGKLIPAGTGLSSKGKSIEFLPRVLDTLYG